MKINIKLSKPLVLSITQKVLFFLWPLLTTFLIHYVQYQDFQTTSNWMLNNIGLVFLNYFALFAVASTITGLFGKYSLGYFITTILGIIISTISFLKYEIRGDVLQVTDVIYLNNMSEFAEFVDFKIFLRQNIILPFIIAIIFGILQLKIVGKNFFDYKKRLIMFFTSALSILLVFGTPISQNYILPLFNLDINIRYVPEVTCEKNGIILGIYVNTLQNKVEIPNDYSEEKVFSILNELKFENKEIQQKPNVVVIMSESFFDPTILPNITYSQDPIPNIRKLLSDYTSGNFVSSTFAGGTGNIEFEVFTGNSIAFLPYGICPFSNIPNAFDTDIPTIQKDFKNNGYKTIAIHPYEEDFYSRNVVYPKLGFDEILFQNDITNPTYNGKYISDDTFVNEIISKIEENNEPVFIYGLSMQNHTPYSMSYYNTPSEIEITADFLSDEGKDKLNAFVKGLHDTDKTVKKLIEYFENSNTPTIFLFYGDHFPSLYEVFLESGFVSTDVTQNWTTEELYKIHSIPFFIYDNFNYQEEYLHDYELGAPLLGNKLLNYAEIKKSPYFHFLDTIDYRAIRDRLFVDSQGNIFSKPYGEYLEEIEKYKILQYDILYGNQFITKK